MSYFRVVGWAGLLGVVACSSSVGDGADAGTGASSQPGVTVSSSGAVAASGSTVVSPGSGTVRTSNWASSSGWTDGGAQSSTLSSSSSSSGSADASAGSGATTIRVHYPVGAHTMTLRGAAAPMSWTADTTLTSVGADTFAYTLPSAPAAPFEVKPVLDGSTWALGPNYHGIPGQTVDIYPHFTTTSGQVSTLIASFHSTVLDNDRPIYAYLPASYAENTDATYPVVYMHDGQNLWAALPQLAFSATWNVDTAFDAASNAGACSSGGVVGWGAQPLGGTPTTCNGDSDCGTGGSCRTFPEAIVIGVANTGATRTYEYTPTVDPSEADAGLGAEGGADLYIQMLVTELKPQIDAMLRTRPDVASTAMAGSSLGGLVTAYAGLKRPDVYGMVAELSPSTWWDSDVIVTDVEGTLPAPMRPGVVYVDSGQGSVDDEADTDMLAAEYLALGYEANVDFRHVIQPGAAHNETYWAERFPGAMQLLLGTR